MSSSGIQSPKGTIEWGRKAKKAEEKGRKGSFRRAAIKDAVSHG